MICVCNKEDYTDEDDYTLMKMTQGMDDKRVWSHTYTITSTLQFGSKGRGSGNCYIYRAYS